MVCGGKGRTYGPVLLLGESGGREWIDCDPFDLYGFMAGLSSTCGNRYTDAACTLMEGRWRGDPVVYLGDYCELSAGTHARSCSWSSSEGGPMASS